MSQRILMGNNPYVGDSGIFISKPGRDISDTSTNYLLDSRFRTLARHTNGRVAATKQGSGSSLYQTWYAEVTFPDLGYVPIFQASFVYSNSTSYGIPANATLIPTNAAIKLGPSGGFPMLNAGAWIAPGTTNVLRCGMKSQRNNIFDLTFDLVYIIFKNRFGE